METIRTIAEITLGLATLSISIFLLVRAGYEHRVAMHERMIRSYDNMSALGLASDENLKALAQVLYPDRTSDLDALRQRLFSYITLNAIELTFVTRSQRGINKNIADPIMRDVLRSVVQNKEAWDIIKAGTYDPKFTLFAEKVKRKQSKADKQDTVEG
jgi:hypothetical protein